ncbi:N-acetyltransferase [Marinococcus halophilus]|nr:GNAT family protein [Marinococcus halophilus]OZT80524.1 N-acetyltransferase [Marinococcus halophilus]
MAEVELVPFEQAHYEKLIEWVPTADFLKQWSGEAFTYPLTAEQLDEYRKQQEGDKPERLIYTALHQATGEPVGHISLGVINYHDRSGRIGKVLVGDEKMRGTGLGQWMVREVCRTAFDELQLHRVALGVFDFNVSALRCYERAGFQREGLKRDLRLVGNTYWSLVEMSMLEDEWEKLR